MVLEETGIGIGELGEADRPPLSGWVTYNLLRAYMEQRHGGKLSSLSP